MATYVFRWETPNGDGPRTSCVVNNNKIGNYRYVFTTMKSALMWIRELAWDYDNPTHSDLVLCIYEADEGYERQSHIINKVAIDYSYKDIRGYERYVC